MDNIFEKGMNKKCLHHFFEEHVRYLPLRTAVEYEDEKITFDQLNRKANQLARILVSHDIKCGDIVGVVMERSINMIIAILATLKSGAIYLPVNIDYPMERNEIILQNSEAKMLICSDKTFCAESDIPMLEINSVLFEGEDTNLNIPITAMNGACVIYTSGSTGVPKGALLSHFSFLNTLSWAKNECSIDSEDVVFNKSAINFDASTFEIFMLFYIGTKLCLCRQGQESNIDYLMKTIYTKKVTICVMVSSLLNVFLDYAEHKKYFEQLKSLKIVFSGGDRLTYLITEKFNKFLHKKYGVKLYNLYGPAETTICCTYFNCTAYQNEDRIVPIGKPISNTRIYILDEKMNKCDVDEIGEIYISGYGVGKRYINDAELTRHKFVTNKFLDSDIMYKSGDLGKWNKDGNIEFCGRIDNQIKIRGNRVELEEIESIMVQYNNIIQATVLYIEDKKMLIAFYRSMVHISETDYKQYLKDKIPAYMIPARLIEIEQFPLINTGKIDRKELALKYLPEAFKANENANGNESVLEKEIVQIIEDIVYPNSENRITFDLDLQSAGIDSLKFVNIVVALEERFHFEFDYERLLIQSFSTVKELIDYVVHKTKN